MEYMRSKRLLIMGCGLVLVFAIGCSDRKLPILGERELVSNGKGGVDTVFPSIANFSFVDQDSSLVSNSSFANKIYVADFIFLSCPSICPKMTAQMRKVYAKFAGDARVGFLSHTIDPAHDSVGRLRSYTKALGISSAQWHFVTGNADSIFTIAKKSYYSTAYPDSAEPGNYIHSGGLLLVDRNRHVRGVYDGTDTIAVEKLMGDMQILLKEQF